MHFSDSDIQRFAQWSADRNPLHVDREFARGTSFKQPIVHGMLSALGALGSIRSRSADPLRALEIEFRGAVFPEAAYDVEAVRGPGELTVVVGRDDQTVLSLRAEIGPAAAPEAVAPAWTSTIPAGSTNRESPADRELGELERGVEVRGRYAVAAPLSAWTASGLLTPNHARVLGLCSYLVGMEIPGLRSLFTRLSVRFFDASGDFHELCYRARTTRLDPQFRILDTVLEVASPDGALFATAEIRSYVRFTPRVLDLDALAATLAPAGDRLGGRVALVCGGSRGLGADLTAALALAGCHVYSSYHGGADAARELGARLADRGLAAEFLCGDAGDPQWCRTTGDAIRSRHGRLDVLVLNACAPPPTLQISPETTGKFDEYVAANLRLATVPLAAFLPLLRESQGSIVGISSSFVADPQPGFSHYVALKQALEGAIGVATRESGVWSLIARPPRLQTSWNDTPTGVLGAIPSDWVASGIVARLAGDRQPGVAELLTDFPSPSAAPADDGTEPEEPQFTLALAASFTAEPLVPAFRFWFRELGVAGHVDVAPYGQVLQELLNPASGLSTNARGANVVLLRVRDWLRELPDEQAQAAEFVRSYLADTSRDFERALRAHRAHAHAETLLIVCPPGRSSAPEIDGLLGETGLHLQNAARGLPGLTVVPADDCHRLYGVSDDAIDDPLRDKIAHVPYQDSYLAILATLVMRRIHRRLAAPRKVVVVDCDNTLWKGVVGEVGPEGIEIEEHHRQLQLALDRLSRSGVLVCLCSKNEESDVWRVFETRSDFLLRREQVVAAMIDWQPKSENVRRLASRLNLGLDSFVFLDDNPVECAEVAAACPEVLTLNWPLESARALKLLDHVWEFDADEGTREDQQRTRMYQEEFRRQALKEDTLTFRDFLSRLELVVDFQPLAADDLARAAQLTHRTNQFNFTTRRREEGELKSLLSDGRHAIFTVRVRDRFGDYGLVGLAIAAPEPERLEVDTFLLSCRVLGRGVEHHMASELGRFAQKRGLGTVRMRVERTRRNAPARSFLESICPAGLQKASDEVLECDLPAGDLARLRFEPADAPAAPVQDVADARPSATASASVGPRRREQQIARTAYELSRPADLHAAVAGRQAAHSAPAPAVVPAEGEIAQSVYEVFAAALKLSADEVRSVDRLEALGCGSFKIVEITVELVARFPWLPSTLLFEHRSVAEIVRSITELSRPKQAGAAASSAVAAEAPRQREAARSLDIAVVGMGLRCAQARSPDEFWRLLSSAGSAVRPVPADRPYFLGSLRDDRPHFAGLMDSIDEFDAEFFGISPREAELVDPQLRLFLIVAWEALEDAGCFGSEQDPETGVFAGVMYGDYAYRANIAARESENPFKCWEGFSLANRVSQLLGFHGPSIAVDTACSSSGTALHLACQALTSGDCTTAVVGGVNLILDPDRFVQLGRLGILSLSGNCRPFGAEADGTVLGEGVGVVVLRPLAEAIARGDRIYGIIKGTGVSTGSGTVGFTAPNPQAQAEAIRRAIKSARVDPRTISYVETHGTGTLLGDPIEVRGLSLAYEDRELWDPRIHGEVHCRLGAVKPNVGHLEAGAGIVGLIKVLLQLREGTFAPSITSPEANPQIGFAGSHFEVQRALMPWNRTALEIDGTEQEVPRRAAISSFGVGGANAHIIIEEPPPVIAAEGAECARPAQLLTISARNEGSLRDMVAAWRLRVESEPEIDLADACHTANTGRRHFEQRLALPVLDRQQLLTGLGRFLDGEESPGCSHAVVPGSRPPPRIAFLFTGQGSQYAGMGRPLYETQPVFRAALDLCAAALGQHLERPLFEVLFAPADSPDRCWLDQTGFTQPALFAIEYALAQLWKSWGIRPDVVLGHSVGEIAALCVAGGVSLEDGAKLIAARGRLMQALPPGGAMTSVMIGESAVMAAIAGYEERVSIAAINGPEHVVITGEGAALAEITAKFRSDGIRTKTLTVSHAFHSPLMDPMLSDYAAVVREIHFEKPQIPLISGARGELASDALVEPDYWVSQVREPVRFSDAMAALERLSVTAYVEVGPHPVLLGMGRSCLSEAGDGRLWLGSMRRDGDPWQTVLASLASLYVAGAPVDWRGFDAPYPRRKVSIPTYAFGHERFWIEPPVAPAPTASAPALAVAAESGRPHDLFQLAWRKRPRPENGQPHTEAGRWLILADRGGVGSALADLLSQRGGNCTLVYPGRKYAGLEPGLCEIDAASGDDFARLWRDLVAGGPIRGIVHLWGLEAAENSQLTDETLKAAESSALGSVVRIVQALVGPHATGTPALWLMTRGAVSIETAIDGPIALAQAPLWGLGRTIALEHPEVWGGVIDLGSGPDVTGDLQAAVHEMLGHDVEDQLAFRNGARYVARLAPLPAREPRDFSCAGEGTYLVTGGVGALGRRVARWLVSRGARRLVLTSRRGRSTPEAEEALKELTAAGAEVDIVAADVACGPDVDRLFERISVAGVPLRGIIHAAGIDAVTPLARVTQDELSSVLAPKVAGGWLLHERARALPLDFFISFSSISAVLGSAGRAAYGAANAFLDALAHERRRTGLAALSVDWGPWRGGGMATDEGLVLLERMGNNGLDPDTALKSLEVLLAGGDVQAVVADIDWERFRVVYEARRARPVLAEILPPAAEEAAAAPGAGGPSTSGANGTARVEANGTRAAAGPQTASDMEVLVRTLVAQTLGLKNPADVRKDKTFYEMGLDSLLAAEFSSKLHKKLGIRNRALVFDYPYVESLAAHLHAQLARPTNAASAAAETAAAEAPAPVATEAIPTGEPAPQNRITGYEPGIEPEVFEFQQQAWPNRDRDLLQPRWKWMYVESARRLGLEPRVWLYRDGGKIVGHNGAIPVKLKVGREELTTAWFVETMVLEEYRSQAAGSRLMLKAREDLPFSLSLGQTEQMREIILKLGWHQVAPLETAQLLIRPETVLKGKMSSPAALAAGSLLRASTAVRTMLQTRSRLDVQQVTRFETRHDRLWEAAARDIPCGVVRDASYLNWKYVDQPGQDFLRLEIFDADALCGVVVLMFRNADEAYQYRRAFLVEIVAPQSNLRLLKQLVHLAGEAAAERGADAVVCLHVGQQLTKALRQSGFMIREPGRFLVVNPGDLPEPARRQLLTAGDWFVTQGDSDIDRP